MVDLSTEDSRINCACAMNADECRLQELWLISATTWKPLDCAGSIQSHFSQRVLTVQSWLLELWL